MGAGMGAGGHSNNPAFMFQGAWNKAPWKGAVLVGTVVSLGVYVPCKAVAFAQKKAGVW